MTSSPRFPLRERWCDLLVHGLVQLCSLRALDKYLLLSGEGAIAVSAGLAQFACTLPTRLPGRFRRWLENPVGFWLVAGATMTGLHLYFWQLDPAAYAPFHLFAKPVVASPWMRLLLAGACLGYVPVFLRLRGAALGRWEGLLLGALLVPLVQVAAAQWFWQGRSFARWEAANYLMPCVGPALAWVGLSWSGSRVAAQRSQTEA